MYSSYINNNRGIFWEPNSNLRYQIITCYLRVIFSILIISVIVYMLFKNYNFDSICCSLLPRHFGCPSLIEGFNIYIATMYPSYINNNRGIFWDPNSNLRYQIINYLWVRIRHSEVHLHERVSVVRHSEVHLHERVSIIRHYECTSLIEGFQLI